MAEISLRQIADKVGCSRATVSYALRNCSNISEGMRERVWGAAAELGWTPDALLAKQMSIIRGRLVRRDRPRIALVVYKGAENLRRERASFEQRAGVLEYAERMGYSVDEFNLIDAPMRPSRLKSIIVARGIEAVIFLGALSPEMPSEYLEIGHDFAAVICGVRSDDAPFHIVVNDHLAAGRLAVTRMVAAGHRRPGVVLPLGVDRPLGFGYTGGVGAGLVDLPPQDQLKVFYAGRGEAYIPSYQYAAVAEWIDRHRPDGLLTTDVASMQAILASQTTAMRDLPVYALDWFPGQGAAGGVDLLQRQLGESAVDLVVGQLHCGARGMPSVQRALSVEGAWRLESVAVAEAALFNA